MFEDQSWIQTKLDKLGQQKKKKKKKKIRESQLIHPTQFSDFKITLELNKKFIFYCCVC